ncbi:MAG: choice-of-anchor D domain-containing protein, partial [Candidatus Acidiferrales bacterium]
MAFEPWTSGQFLGRGRGLTVVLGRDAISVSVAARNSGLAAKSVQIAFEELHGGLHRMAKFAWEGAGTVEGESNYFLGRNAAAWRSHVPRYQRAQAENIFRRVGVSVYGSQGGLEYDLHLGPGASAARLRLAVRGADSMRLDRRGDLLIEVAGRELKMKAPQMFEAAGNVEGRRRVRGGYRLEADGEIGFWTLGRDAGDSLIIDPELTLAYGTFLGGAGDDEAEGIAVDAAGNIYVSGTTTSAGNWPGEAANAVGQGAGATDFFVAKLSPSIGGSASVAYLTFIGGSGAEAGGRIAVDSKGEVVLTGTTVSPDYPTTDFSPLTAGANDAVVTMLDAGGANLLYSTIYGGSGQEASLNPGGIAVDAAGDTIYVAGDTTSQDLCASTVTNVTPTPWDYTYGGGATDGYVVMLQPAQVPAMRYCTYLGIVPGGSVPNSAAVAVTSAAADADGNVYIGGYTGDPLNSFPAPTATMPEIQSQYAGGISDGFLMKIAPSGNGPGDLIYATLVGGQGADQVLAIALGSQSPATLYAVGTTQNLLADAPHAGLFGGVVPVNAGFQPSYAAGGTNGFLAAVGENVTDAGTVATTLEYLTYIGGGSQESDSAVSVAVTPAATPLSNGVYVAGTATSPTFPWLDNAAPMNGTQAAYLMKIDATQVGGASLLYATPLGGSAPAGTTTATSGAAVATDGAGHVFAAGETTAPDFPEMLATVTGPQATCSSCVALPGSPALPDAFVAEIAESAGTPAAVSFQPTVMNLGAWQHGTSSGPLNGELLNSGASTLTITQMAASGPNAGDFSVTGSCIPAANQPAVTVDAGKPCYFTAIFTPSQAGPEGAQLVVTDNAPGSPQVVDLQGFGDGAQAEFSTTNLDFPNTAVGGDPGKLIPQLVVIENAGNLALTIGLGQPSNSAFVANQQNCDSVAPGNTCNITVTFNPPATGNFQGTLTLTDNSGGAAGAQQVITFEGAGVAGQPSAVPVPAALTFAAQTQGTASGPQTVALANNGQAPLALAGVAIVGAGATQYTASGGVTGPCPFTGGTLAVGASCTVNVTFTPASVGPTPAANLIFTDNAGGTAGTQQSVALTGSGTATTTAAVAPASVAFGTQSVGATGTPVNVTLTNTGTALLSSVAVSMTDSGDFSAATSSCLQPINAGASCTIAVTFHPTTTGPRSALLSVTDNAAGSPQTVSLGGTGVQANASVSAARLQFPAQLIGANPVAANSTIPITVTDTGQGALQINRVTFSDATAYSYASACAGNAAVPIQPNRTCAIQVTFDPKSGTAGQRNATMTIYDNSPSGSQTVTLSGIATDFALQAATGGNPQLASATVI